MRRGQDGLRFRAPSWQPRWALEAFWNSPSSWERPNRHPAVAEAAVVPAPDPVRLAVPKAYVILAPGDEPTRDTALLILTRVR
ncbi:AMP-binding enzyme [Kribbella sp. GL6]|uniref:AMP-binding enzyme n=1 Tax=Kribbella sp. GL6 TaxID=3419765 RepID=UPI003CFBC7CF